jgi:hypothetical protein
MTRKDSININWQHITLKKVFNIGPKLPVVVAQWQNTHPIIPRSRLCVQPLILAAGACTIKHCASVMYKVRRKLVCLSKLECLWLAI